MKAIFIPGNGGGSPADNWFPWLEKELTNLGVQVINVRFPDAELARASYWLPFLESLGAGEDTFLVGHSSGAIAAMRYAETHTILGSVLVGVYYTDLGYDSEKASGYFDAPWDWDAIVRHQSWVIEFASTDDPFITTDEPRFVRDRLGATYYEFTDRGHFGHGGHPQTTFPELLFAIREKTAL